MGSATGRTASRPNRTRRRSPPTRAAWCRRTRGSARCSRRYAACARRSRAAAVCPPPALRQLRVGADHLTVLAFPLALPHVERRAPVAVARQRPIHVVLEPLPEPPTPDLRRVPADLRIHLEHPRLHRRRAHEPRAAGVVDERRVAAPAEGIAVRVGPGLHPPPLVLEALDDQPVRLLVADEPAVDLF